MPSEPLVTRLRRLHKQGFAPAGWTPKICGEAADALEAAQSTLNARALLSHLLQIETNLLDTIEDFEPCLIDLQRRRIAEMSDLLSKIITSEGGSNAE